MLTVPGAARKRRPSAPRRLALRAGLGDPCHVVERLLADGLTWLRVGAALALPVLGVVHGPASLPLATALLLYSWTSDALDGALARRAGDEPSWIGARDLEVDIGVSAGLAGWLAGAGFVPWPALAAYALAWAAAFTWMGVQRSPGMLVQAPVYAWFIAVTLRDEPWAGASLLVWIAAAVTATWPRFPQEIVPEFVGGMRGVWRDLRAHAPHRRRAEGPPSVLCRTPAQPVPAEARRITVLSANLWHDWPRRRRLRERLEAFARLVEREAVDVVLLQEVSRASLMDADRWLAGRLGMAWAYARANGHRLGIGFEEGVAVLSRFPIAEARVQPLGVPGWLVRRLALAAHLEVPGGDLWAVSAHLSLRPWRGAAQISHLRGWVEGLAGDAPALVGGDFNAPERTRRSAALRRDWRDPFRELHPEADAATFGLRGPGTLARARLDYVLLRPGKRRLRCVAARHLEAPGAGHSDHRAVLVRLERE